MISNLHCEQGTIYIYDTAYCDIDEETRELVGNIFDSKVDIDMFKHIQKQKEGMDCGVFSIAIATSLLHRYYIGHTQSTLHNHHLDPT